MLLSEQQLMPIILATWKAEIVRIKVEGQPRQTVHKTPISKITTAKWTGDMAQMLECLFCKCKPVSSNLCSTNKIYALPRFPSLCDQEKPKPKLLPSSQKWERGSHEV
jgi:hypothetical protein